MSFVKLPCERLFLKDFAFFGGQACADEQTKKRCNRLNCSTYSTPDWIRTSDLQSRSKLRYLLVLCLFCRPMLCKTLKIKGFRVNSILLHLVVWYPVFARFAPSN